MIHYSFNTWAREEPNSPEIPAVRFLHGFNTWAREEPNAFLCFRAHTRTCFNTWAREEPNVMSGKYSVIGKKFQYLGSRGAQHNLIYNEWFRDEFQYLGSRGAQRYEWEILGDWEKVSILGLARSPTSRADVTHPLWFQYLGSRGAQRRGRMTAVIFFRFQYLGSRGAQPR